MTYIFNVTYVNGEKAILVGKTLPMPRSRYMYVRQTEVHDVVVIDNNATTEKRKITRPMKGNIEKVLARLVSEYHPCKVIKSMFTSAWNFRGNGMDLTVVID